MQDQRKSRSQVMSTEHTKETEKITRYRSRSYKYTLCVTWNSSSHDFVKHNRLNRSAGLVILLYLSVVILLTVWKSARECIDWHLTVFLICVYSTDLSMYPTAYIPTNVGYALT